MYCWSIPRESGGCSLDGQCSHSTVVQHSGTSEQRTCKEGLYLPFVRRSASLEGTKCIRTMVKMYFGPGAVSFVERFIALCFCFVRVHCHRFHCITVKPL